MPVIADPETELPDKTKGVKPSQLILWLLFPVIFAVGFTVGLVVGIKQGEQSAEANFNNSRANTTVIPNTNSRIVTNTANANTNISNAFANLTNRTQGGGDYLKISANTQTQLDAQKQQDLDRLVDKTASVEDQIRQQDLISMKYDLKAYYSVKNQYPGTGGVETKIEGQSNEAMYTELRAFFGGSYNLKVDPRGPTNYYTYTSDGSTFTLTALLTGPKTLFTVTDK